MNVDELIINVNSEQPEEMIAFYRDVVGLATNPDIAPGAFAVGSTTFLIEGHSEIKGSTKEPQRVLMNFVVQELASEQERLEAQGVTFTRKAADEPGVGLFSTFIDPDGNYCQLIQFYG